VRSERYREHNGETRETYAEQHEIPFPLSGEKQPEGYERKNQRERRGQESRRRKHGEYKKLRRILKILGIPEQVKKRETA
jgi:hypothetical protein